MRLVATPPKTVDFPSSVRSDLIIANGRRNDQAPSGAASRTWAVAESYTPLLTELEGNLRGASYKQVAPDGAALRVRGYTASCLVGVLILILPHPVRAEAGVVPESPALARRAPSPRIEFPTTVFEFGKVLAGEVVKHNFVFTNTGSSTLNVLEVTPSCGCTTAGTWDRSIEPGNTGSIPLQFNSGNFDGPVTKMATVTCTDPVASNVVLQLTGTVFQPVEIIPPVAAFEFTGGASESQTKSLRIVGNLPESLALSDLQCTNAAFHAELKTIEPGKEFELSVTVRPRLTTAYLFMTITLKTSYPQMPIISVPANARLLNTPPSPPPVLAQKIFPTTRVIATRPPAPDTAAK